MALFSLNTFRCLAYFQHPKHLFFLTKHLIKHPFVVDKSLTAFLGVFRNF